MCVLSDAHTGIRQNIFNHTLLCVSSDSTFNRQHCAVLIIPGQGCIFWRLIFPYQKNRPLVYARQVCQMSTQHFRYQNASGVCQTGICYQKASGVCQTGSNVSKNSGQASRRPRPLSNRLLSLWCMPDRLKSFWASLPQASLQKSDRLLVTKCLHDFET